MTKAMFTVPSMPHVIVKQRSVDSINYPLDTQKWDAVVQGTDIRMSISRVALFEKETKAPGELPAYEGFIADIFVKPESVLPWEDPIKLIWETKRLDRPALIQVLNTLIVKALENENKADMKDLVIHAFTIIIDCIEKNASTN